MCKILPESSQAKAAAEAYKKNRHRFQTLSR